ncbi:hypothetical protein J6590_027920 [Homalodisca vitripennis]|nr:hypothetical protein J6590_027920 [Homalodisca vitripennis]
MYECPAIQQKCWRSEPPPGVDVEVEKEPMKDGGREGARVQVAQFNMGYGLSTLGTRTYRVTHDWPTTQTVTARRALVYNALVIIATSPSLSHPRFSAASASSSSSAGYFYQYLVGKTAGSTQSP